MLYINRKDGFNHETVNEYDETEREDAKQDLAQYRQSDPAGVYFLAGKPCRNWEAETA